MRVTRKFIHMATHLKPERRFSRKIMVGRINRQLPFLRPVINWIRFVTFRRQCLTYPEPNSVYTDGHWTERKVTKDQNAIEEYISSRVTEESKILHVGIGNSNVAKKWPGSVVDGITVVSGEKTFADSLGLPHYHTRIMDKNDVSALKTLPGKYDYILDNDIAAYSCCKRHFFDMLATYTSMLSPRGEILVGAISVTYFDSGFPLPAKYLKETAAKIGLDIEYREDLIVLRPTRPVFAS